MKQLLKAREKPKDNGNYRTTDDMLSIYKKDTFGGSDVIKILDDSKLKKPFFELSQRIMPPSMSFEPREIKLIDENLTDYQINLIRTYFDDFQCLKKQFKALNRDFSYKEIFVNLDHNSDEELLNSLDRIKFSNQDMLTIRSNAKPIIVDSSDDSYIQSKDKQFKARENVKPLDKEELKKIWVEKQKIEKEKERIKRQKKIKPMNEPLPKKFAMKPDLIKLQMDHLASTLIFEKKDLKEVTDKFLKKMFCFQYQDIDKEIEAIKVIPDRFESFYDYKSSFEPHLLYESRSKIKLELETKLKYEKEFIDSYIKLLHHDFTSSYTAFELTINIQHSSSKDKSKTDDNNNSFEQRNKKNLQSMTSLSMFNNFLILITNMRCPNLQQISNSEMIENSKFAFLGLLTVPEYKENNFSIRTWIDSYKLRNQFKQGSYQEIRILPIEKMSTYIREYFSLLNLMPTTITQQILNPSKISTEIDESIKSPESLLNFFDSIKGKFNRGQLCSIAEACLKDKGLVFLQGPPGTGKTHTIMGIVSGLILRLQVEKKSSMKIMICAPSNAAIDEIVTRLITVGIFNEEGDNFFPRIIRVGPMENSENILVKSVWIDHLVQKETSGTKEKMSLKEIKDRVERLRIRIQKLEKEIEKHPVESEQYCQKSKELPKLKNEYSILNSEYTQMKSGKSEQKEKKCEIISRLLNDAEIICTTLSSSKSEKLDSIKDLIHTIVIDEAAQVYNIDLISVY